MIQRSLCAFLLCLAVANPGAIAATPGEVPVGGILRDAPLQGLNGPLRQLSEYRGRPLIINVWASWCGPCREEMASLERLPGGGSPPNFLIIGVLTGGGAGDTKS